MSQIRELAYEENLLDKCYKRFIKELSKGIYKYDCIMEIDAILDLALRK